ncbi:UNVERIFIED_CONTAM: Disease resistance RPP8-like protein 3 [Sesamum indicum]
MMCGMLMLGINSKQPCPRVISWVKVLMTSRFENMTRRANRKREPQRFWFLSREESWELLQVQVFGEIDRCPSELKPTGRLIAEQCCRLPLQIVVIGGILLNKLSSISNTKNEWENVSDRLGTYVNDEEQKRVERIILLSYDELPYDLRDCFLYRRL